MTYTGANSSVLILSLAFQAKSPRRPTSITSLTEKLRWISAVSQFALHELTLCNNEGDWIKGKSPAGNLVGCHPAFGGRLVKGFTSTGVILLWGCSRSLQISKLFWCYIPYSTPVPAQHSLLRSLAASTSHSVQAGLPLSVFHTRITMSTHLRATDLKFSSSCLH